MWIFNRINVMQHEIDLLKSEIQQIDQFKNDVQEIRKNQLDHGLLNEITEFNKKVSEKTVTQSNLVFFSFVETQGLKKYRECITSCM